MEKSQGLPIKYMLQIPIVKVNLKDEEGNQITDIYNVQYFDDAIYVCAKNGIYTNKPELLKNVEKVELQ